MKKIYLFTLISITTVIAGEPLKKYSQKSGEYLQASIIDKGVVRHIKIPKDRSIINRHSLYRPSDLTAKHGILLRFKNDSTVNISDLENRYHIRLKTKLKTGYLIFENNSKLSDLALINEIMTTEKHIDTLKPNWCLRKQIY